MGQRYSYIDIAKGIGIWCIVCLHYEEGTIPVWLNTVIGSFMISIFYIASGWLSGIRVQSLTTKELFLKRIRQLGLPYLYWTIIILLFDCILWACGYYDSYFVGREIYKSIILRGIGTLWFLPALMGGELIWNWLKDKHCILILLAYLLTCIYFAWYENVTALHQDTIGRILEAPFHTISNILRAWPHVALGYLFYRGIYSKYKWSSCTTGGIGAALFVIGALGLFVSMPFEIFLSPLVNMSLTLGAFLCCIPIHHCHFLEYWGRNSLSLMVTHYSLVMVIFAIINEYCFGADRLHSFAGTDGWIYFFCSIPLQYLIAKLLNNKAPSLLGKKISTPQPSNQ